MSHARKTIRDGIVAAVTGLVTTGTRVYPSRVFPFSDENLPGLLVYAGAEEIDEEEGKIAKIQFRYQEIVVEGYDKLIAGLDDKLDDIASEVETAVFAAGFDTIDLISTDSDIEDGLEQPVGKVTITFMVRYLTDEGAPGTVI